MTFKINSMKGSLFFLALVLPVFFSCVRSGHDIPENEFLIVGELENIRDGVPVAFMYSEDRALKTKYVDTLERGRFEFRDTVSVPRIVHIMCMD